MTGMQTIISWKNIINCNKSIATKLTNIDFKLKKPNKFYTVHKTTNNSCYTKIYDGGEVMFTISENSDKRIKNII